LALLHRPSFQASIINLDFSSKTFEFMFSKLCMPCVQPSPAVGTTKVLIIYRPSSTNLTNEFFDELSIPLEKFYIDHNDFIATGDFNIWIGTPSAKGSKQLGDILSCYNLRQHVSSATHAKGHTLDLVITAEQTNIGPFRIAQRLSDHHPVLFIVKPSDKATTAPPNSVTTKRNLSRLDLASLI
jgi:hypothetical protein